MASMLEKMGVTVDQKDIKVKNVAAVMVTATAAALCQAGKPHRRAGQLHRRRQQPSGRHAHADIRSKVLTATIYALGAGSCQHRRLWCRWKRILDGEEFPYRGAGAVRGHHRTGGPQSILAIVTASMFSLHNPDVTTAARVVEVINAQFAEPVARAQDAGTIEIAIPDRYVGNT
jgi:flagellar P-ring protein precursor FlgI